MFTYFPDTNSPYSQVWTTSTIHGLKLLYDTTITEQLSQQQRTWQQPPYQWSSPVQFRIHRFEENVRWFFQRHDGQLIPLRPSFRVSSRPTRPYYILDLEETP